MSKTIEEINEKIEKNEVVVLTAKEAYDLVKEEGVKKAAEKVDIVTTGTFGAMCSSGVFLNFGHTEPPLKMETVSLNSVPAYGYIAAVDAYLGATARSSENPEYGGGHVIEDLLSGKRIRLEATGAGTDCYPKKDIDTKITLDQINEAIMFNPRNCYQNYAAATNSSSTRLYTYMGALLPRYGNVNYATCGMWSPLLKDPEYRTIGIGTRIFFGGAIGYIAWHGTQHNSARTRDDNKLPIGPAGTLALIGDLKSMNKRYVRGAYFEGYGVSLMLGIGIPIPVIDEDMMHQLSLGNEDIKTVIVDYSVASRSRPIVREVSYQELRSGFVEIHGKMVPTGSTSSWALAREIATNLKQMILGKRFFLSEPVEKLPRDRIVKPLEVRRK
ncbi:homocysteine biosynthesis protein [Thermodesulfobium sp.]